MISQENKQLIKQKAELHQRLKRCRLYFLMAENEHLTRWIPVRQRIDDLDETVRTGNLSSWWEQISLHVGEVESAMSKDIYSTLLGR